MYTWNYRSQTSNTILGDLSIVRGDKSAESDSVPRTWGNNEAFASPVTSDTLKEPPSLDRFIPHAILTNASLKYFAEPSAATIVNRHAFPLAQWARSSSARADWLRYFRKFDLPEIDRSVLVYPCYFLFANRHSFNCSVGLPPGHGRQGSVHFYVVVVFAKCITSPVATRR